jgi:hypothetical protein
MFRNICPHGAESNERQTDWDYEVLKKFSYAVCIGKIVENKE